MIQEYRQRTDTFLRKAFLIQLFYAKNSIGGHDTTQLGIKFADIDGNTRLVIEPGEHLDRKNLTPDEHRFLAHIEGYLTREHNRDISKNKERIVTIPPGSLGIENSTHFQGLVNIEVHNMPGYDRMAVALFEKNSLTPMYLGCADNGWRNIWEEFSRAEIEEEKEQISVRDNRTEQPRLPFREFAR